MTDKQIIERIEVIINRHSPMPNFDTKEYCAKDIYTEILEPALSRQHQEFMEEGWEESKNVLRRFAESVLYEDKKGHIHTSIELDRWLEELFSLHEKK